MAELPLHTWGNPSVDGNVLIPDLQPGSYYFLCGVAGHCNAGMKIEVIVLPSDQRGQLKNPLLGACGNTERQGCAFTYSKESTPIITSVEVRVYCTYIHNYVRTYT